MSSQNLNDVANKVPSLNLDNALDRKPSFSKKLSKSIKKLVTPRSKPSSPTGSASSAGTGTLSKSSSATALNKLPAGLPKAPSTAASSKVATPPVEADLPAKPAQEAPAKVTNMVVQADSAAPATPAAAIDVPAAPEPSARAPSVPEPAIPEPEPKTAAVEPEVESPEPEAEAPKPEAEAIVTAAPVAKTVEEVSVAEPAASRKGGRGVLGNLFAVAVVIGATVAVAVLRSQQQAPKQVAATSTQKAFGFGK